MSATKKQKVTHDVGKRLQWSLRPPISKKKDNYKAKRQNMKDVCLSCHSSTFADGHFYQFDAVVKLYDEKFAKPATEIIKLVKKKGLLKGKANFGSGIDWEYWELWHHEGRRARHGAAMMGPDYTWWHGIYDVIHNFYFKFIPEAKELHDKDVDALIKKIMNDPMHKWLNENTADLKKAIRSGKQQKIYDKLFSK